MVLRESSGRKGGLPSQQPDEGQSNLRRPRRRGTEKHVGVSGPEILGALTSRQCVGQDSTNCDGWRSTRRGEKEPFSFLALAATAGCAGCRTGAHRTGPTATGPAGRAASKPQASKPASQQVAGGRSQVAGRRSRQVQQQQRMPRAQGVWRLCPLVPLRPPLPLSPRPREEASSASNVRIWLQRVVERNPRRR